MALTEPLFTVFPPRSSGRASTRFVLVRDAWDDFGFKTQYALRSSTGSVIGAVKILRRGQTPTTHGLLPDGPLHSLGEEFCSLGQELDYYERIAALEPDERAALLLGLRDVVADTAHGRKFRGEKGWTTSLRRHVGEEAEFDRIAAVLLSRDYTAVIGLGAQLSFHPPGWIEPLVLDFAASEDDASYFPPSSTRRGKSNLPQRIAILTGGTEPVKARFWLG
jgi:hypothetical protein